MKNRTTLLEEDVEEQEVEVGILEMFPDAATFCFENGQEVRNRAPYARETTVKVGDVAFTKNAP